MKESLEKLAAVALLGTHKVGAIPPLDAPGRLAESLAKLAGRDPERHLLDAAAIIATAGRAGFVAPRITPPSETIVAPPEPHPVCPPAAAATLRRILSGEHADLLDQWLRLAADRNLLAPPDALPDLLTAAKNKPDLRATAAGVIGERGRWLARQNPDWAFASGADDADDAEERWRTPWGRDLSLIGAAVEAPKGGTRFSIEAYARAELAHLLAAGVHPDAGRAAATRIEACFAGDPSASPARALDTLDFRLRMHQEFSP